MTERAAIRAVLTGDDRCAALGLTAQSASPVILPCQRLVNAGHDPNRPRHAYRGSTLALRVRSVGEGARLEINHHGTGFIARREGGAGSPVAPTAPVRTRHRARRAA
jgi:hypothetical protein